MKKTVVRIAIAVIAVAFIALGIIRSEQKLVLTKGASICFSCIGLG